MTDDLSNVIAFPVRHRVMPAESFEASRGNPRLPYVGRAKFDRPCPLCGDMIREGDLIVCNADLRLWVCLLHYPDPDVVAAAVRVRAGSLQRWDVVRSRPCPTCGAEPGQPCMTLRRGDPSSTHHAARRRSSTT